MSDLFAEIILPLPLHDTFTYRVPEQLRLQATPGKRAIVQFGRKKFYSGLIFSVHDAAPQGFEIKDIQSVLDDEPVIHPVNIRLWQWMAEYYLCPLGDVMKAALPSALKLESSSMVAALPGSGNTPSETELVKLITAKSLSLAEIQKKMGSRFSFRELQQLINQKIICLEETVFEKYKPKTRPLLQLHPSMDSPEKWQQTLDSLTRAPKQQELMRHIAEKTALFSARKNFELPKKELLAGTTFSEAILNQLIAKEILTVRQETVSRLDESLPLQTDLNLLNNDQQQALEKIGELFKQKQVVLMHGVTASGKTEIYIHLIDQVCRQGKQALYLVPEISLTPQIVNRLKKVFGNKVGVYHSRMNDAERAEVWNHVLSFGKSDDPACQIILGARSSVFLPFANLGLIIADEEHENSYKQFDPAPRYNARDMAVMLGYQHHAAVLLGSATPSFESYMNAKTGKYGLVELLKRYSQVALPNIRVADLQRAYKRKEMRSVLTPELFEEIEKALQNQEQVILFQNRRGYSPFVECMNCGWIPRCVNCDVSLTYHKQQRRLNCHYCGFSFRMPETCGQCGSPDIKTRGFGTEKIEDEIAPLFPEARIARMDLDSTRSRNAFDKIIHQLEARKIDILVGTQMVTKGLDFEHVSVVGILNADNLLNFPDFRAHERAFQLMLQVSGRAGRLNKQGTVVIQTSQPEHPVLRQVINHDYESLFRQLMEERKTFHYPPWYRLIKIAVKHRNPSQLEIAATELGNALKKTGLFLVLGPEYPLVARIQLWHIKEIWLKTSRDKNLAQVRQEIETAVKNTRQLPYLSGAVFNIDVDPM